MKNLGAVIVTYALAGMFAVGFCCALGARPEVPQISVGDRESIQLRFNRRTVISYQFRELEAEYHKRVDALNDEYTKLGKELQDKVDEAYKSAGADKDKFEFDLEKGVFVQKAAEKR